MTAIQKNKPKVFYRIVIDSDAGGRSSFWYLADGIAFKTMTAMKAVYSNHQLIKMKKQKPLFG